MKYGEAFTRLTANMCAIIFIKANGEPRCMLATRHVSMASRYCGFFGGEIDMLDRRNAKNNNVLAVIDMEINETRSLNTDRLVTVIELEEPTTREEFEERLEKFKQFRDTYMEQAWGIKKTASMDSLDEDNSEEATNEVANRIFGDIQI